PGGITSHSTPYEQPVYPSSSTTATQSLQGAQILSSYSGSYALLIGESQYTEGWSILESIPSELAQVEDVLRKQGFHVEKSFNLNADQLGNRFKTFINDYGFDENNRLLFFYSGHGHTLKDKGYLVPTDAPNPHFDKKGFLQKAVTMNEILAMARRMDAKHALFLFDSCFSGTVFKAKALPKMPRQISQMAELPVRQFITAGSADESVPAKSVFTPAFVDALRYGLGDLYKGGYVT
ncbi:MAG: caspase family protein, partial [Candidatus Parabeggiatoa sp.]|nr:caspase family protein [Candidatus Parabeggiatoa sp.]